MRGISLAAVVTASIVLGSVFTFFAVSSVYNGAGTMLGTGIMTDECREYQEGHRGMHHWGMNHRTHDDCHGYDHDHDWDGNHEDCHEYAEDHEDYHEMFEECSEHHEEHQDGHHMMHHD
jgi:hypothetical protein